MGKDCKLALGKSRTVSLSSILLLLLLTMASGCGDEITKLAPVAPQEPPPTSPPPTTSQSGTVTLSPQYAALGQGGSVQFNALVNGSDGNGSVQWLVNGIAGGNAAVGTVNSTGEYTAPQPLSQSQNVTLTATLPGSPQSSATSVVSLIQPGILTDTLNPQVVIYSIYLPAPGSVTISFGPTTTYGLTTWSQTTPSSTGGMVSILVAGMRAQTNYHMQAQVTLNDGATFTDIDHTFAAGTPPGTASVTASVENGGTPQNGIELFDTSQPAEPAQLFATDLQGNVIWTYAYGGPPVDIIQPAVLLPNGHFLVQISYASSAAVKNVALPSGTIDEIREVDLAGNTIRSLNLQQLATALSAQGYTLNLGSFHHDVLPLPNGHIVLLCSDTETISNLAGESGPVNVLGDVLVDVDQNFTPDWVWNSFDHLDVNRHPYLFPDWTHSNAMLYSADDHNLLLSIRHQNWIVKIDFDDGTGSGNILWRLGEGGDFTLHGGADPIDWFYAQHDPSYFTPNTTGVFTLGIMDNGDDRIYPAGSPCNVSAPPSNCLYSTAEVLQVDESNMTATLLSNYAPASAYSFYGGNVDWVPNGDYVVDFCSIPSGALIQELNPGGQVVWQATTPGAAQYRAERLPSLYPGVQW